MEPGFKYPIYANDNFTIYLERVKDGPLMLHVDHPGKWTKLNKIIFQGVLTDILSGIKEPILALPMIDDVKMRKFTKVCNLEKLQDFKCLDGVERPLYVWRGK